jgi:hypothetical protein
MPKAKWPAMEKCVADVKKKGSATNAYAVCYDSVMGVPMNRGKKKAVKEINGEFILDPELAVLYKAGEIGYCPECKKNMPGMKPGMKCPKCETKLIEMGKKEVGEYDVVEQAVKEGLNTADKSNPGHAGRPGKVGGSLPKGAGAAKKPRQMLHPKQQLRGAERVGAVVGGVAGIVGGTALSASGNMLGIMGPTVGVALGRLVGRGAAKQIAVAKMAAKKLRKVLGKAKTGSTKAAEMGDEEASDALIEAFIQALENYNPEEAKKESSDVKKAVKEGLSI